MGDTLYRLIWMKFISPLSMYVRSGTHRHLYWWIFVVLTQIPTVLWILQVPPNSEICRNVGISCGFRAVAARDKYPGFILYSTWHFSSVIWSMIISYRFRQRFRPQRKIIWHWPSSPWTDSHTVPNILIPSYVLETRLFSWAFAMTLLPGPLVLY